VIIGFEEVAEVGELFKSFDSTNKARQHILSLNERRSKKDQGGDLKDEKDIEKRLKVVLKVDVKGSLEVLRKIMQRLKEEKIGIRILKSGVGEITDSDVRITDSEKAKVIGFRVKPNMAARSMARQKNIEILTFDVIYDVVEGTRKLMSRMIERKKEKVILGRMKVLVVFKSQKRGEKKYRQIFGGKVLEGEIRRTQLEIERKGEILGKGKIIEIQEQKRVIDKAKESQEVGISYEGNLKIKQEDILVVYEFQEV
ncbi:MAG: hypothetical protein O2U61_04770, partial [Candidatus Bathyarchaeota archaeon]|nr:hypothetical protein [Candidatus Bathyarchaeota archaeon]